VRLRDRALRAKGIPVLNMVSGRRSRLAGYAGRWAGSTRTYAVDARKEHANEICLYQ
jgi:hypothetical protein